MRHVLISHNALKAAHVVSLQAVLTAAVRTHRLVRVELSWVKRLTVYNV